MEETEKLYTIGRIAKMCNIPPHQLRAYDKCGIFSPEIRDENNNYRYYSERQLGDLLLIQELNRFGIPLKTIVALVQNQELFLLKSMLEENLQQMRRELEQKQQQYHQLVDALLRIQDGIMRLGGGEAARREREDICLVEVPRRPVIYTRYRSEADVEATFLPRYVELLRLAEEHHLASFGPIRAVLYEHYTWQFHARTRGEPLGDLELNQDVSQTDASPGHIRYYGGFQAVSAVHVGPFRQMEALHTRMAEWAAAKGHRVCGISIQEYIVGRTITSDEENFVTRIYLPVDVETI